MLEEDKEVEDIVKKEEQDNIVSHEAQALPPPPPASTLVTLTPSTPLRHKSTGGELSGEEQHKGIDSYVGDAERT
ncbi:hypothetical protein CVT26_014479 [Gymnopilus dilepis]|uniref:Uncharacterized protein n=1 Tax=Gymnopilus dilepis TaxID=231916 RepID=A0A409VVE0_9AGAR|nr:hypothetical protein CVT26_014479 [Gymnopilus dilepis]